MARNRWTSLRPREKTKNRWCSGSTGGGFCSFSRATSAVQARSGFLPPTRPGARWRSRSATPAAGSRPPTRFSPPRAQPLQLLGIATHAEGKPHLSQDGLDLVQRLLAEVLGLEQLRLGLLHQVGDGPDAGGLEAVGRADGELELVHVAEEVLVELDPGRRLDPGLANFGLGRRALRKIRQQVELVLENAGGLADRRLWGDAAVGPHLAHAALEPRLLLRRLA